MGLIRMELLSQHDASKPLECNSLEEVDLFDGCLMRTTAMELHLCQ